MRLVGILFLSLLCYSGMAQSKYLKIAGDWEGTINAGSKPLKVVSHIKYEDAQVSATLDTPDRNAYGLKVDEISFVDGVLKMKSNIVNGSYEGIVNNNKVEGKWSQAGQSFELNLSKKLKKGAS